MLLPKFSPCRSFCVDLWAQSSLLVWGQRWNFTNNSNVALQWSREGREGNAAEGPVVSSPLAPQCHPAVPVSPELFYTERAHVRTLKVLHNVFYQRVTREGILSSSDKRKIFSNLEDILGLHGRNCGIVAEKLKQKNSGKWVWEKQNSGCCFFSPLFHFWFTKMFW